MATFPQHLLATSASLLGKLEQSVHQWRFASCRHGEDHGKLSSWSDAGCCMNQDYPKASRRRITPRVQDKFVPKIEMPHVPYIRHGHLAYLQHWPCIPSPLASLVSQTSNRQVSTQAKGSSGRCHGCQQLPCFLPYSQDAMAAGLWEMARNPVEISAVDLTLQQQPWMIDERHGPAAPQ